MENKETNEAPKPTPEFMERMSSTAGLKVYRNGKWISLGDLAKSNESEDSKNNTK
jgi:hypothetical protein